MKALLSVYDKTGIVELAKFLLSAGYELISSGGTATHLKNEGLEVTEVSDITKSPEMLGGRVKTLHPAVHGGILARRDHPSDLEELTEQSIDLIDLVCVNLYPFTSGLERNLSDREQIELIDIGGPTMLRSAAKNYHSVIVLSDPSQYRDFMKNAKANALSMDYRKSLSASVFRLMAQYDQLVADYLLPSTDLHLVYELVDELRYGENPHQSAKLYRDKNNPGFMSDYTLLAGKALSFSNLADVEAAYQVVLEFSEPCVCAVKHNTPCGVALGETIEVAYSKAQAADPVSIFGGVVACNKTVTKRLAEEMIEIFLEVIVAPKFSPEAREVFQKKPNVRLVEIQSAASQAMVLKSLNGALLVQTPDVGFSQDQRVVTKVQPSEKELTDLEFANKVVKHVKSNAIVIAKDLQTLGIGGGQTNRIDAARLALRSAKEGAVLASDGFFPFDDVVRAAAEGGIRAIIQPGGSIKDEQSINACDELGLAMVLTGRRHFRH